MSKIKEIILEKEDMVLIQEYSNPDIFLFRIKECMKHCYIVLAEQNALLIDPPLMDKKEHAQLLEVFHELGLFNKKVEVFFTHLHCGKFGYIPDYFFENTAVYLNENETLSLTDNQLYECKISRLKREGLLAGDILKETRCGKRFAQRNVFLQIPVSDGSEISVGKHVFQCIDTPGHTKGHTCLWQKEHKILFSGEILKTDQTPLVDVWDSRESSLETMFKSIDKLRTIPDSNVIYTSRNVFEGGHLKILDNLIASYYLRLLEIYQLIYKKPGVTAYELCLMREHMNSYKNEAHSWDVLSRMNDTLAFLILLRKRGYVSIEKDKLEVRNFPGKYQLTDICAF